MIMIFLSTEGLRGVSPFSGNLLFLGDIAEPVGTHADEQAST
jgi:hypothetical protein